MEFISITKKCPLIFLSYSHDSAAEMPSRITDIVVRMALRGLNNGHIVVSAVNSGVIPNRTVEYTGTTGVIPIRKKGITPCCKIEIEPIKQTDLTPIRRQEKILPGELEENSLAAFGISWEALSDEPVSPPTEKWAHMNRFTWSKAVRPAVWHKNVVPLAADVLV